MLLFYCVFIVFYKDLSNLNTHYKFFIIKYLVLLTGVLTKKCIKGKLRYLLKPK